MSSNQNRRGVLELIFACAVFSINDVLTKILVLSYPSGQVLFGRGVLTVAFLSCALFIRRHRTSFLALVKTPILIRAALEGGINIALIIALVHMRVAELTALNLASPLFITMLVALFFKVSIGWRRWAAVVVGLCGALLIVKPSPGTFNLWAIVVLGASFASALRDLTTRQIASHVSSLGIALISAIAVTLVGFGACYNENWVSMSVQSTCYLVGAAFALSVGTFFAVAAFRHVDISVVAPFRYTLLVWGGLAAYFALGEIPDVWSVLGAALIVGSGLYTLHRENVRHRHVTTITSVH